MTHDLLYRLGFAAEVFYCACNVPLILLFYDLFKVVNRSVALLVVFFSLVGTAIESASLLNQFAPLLLLQGGQTVSGLDGGADTGAGILVFGAAADWL